MNPHDAIEISNLAGAMLEKVERRIAWLHGRKYPIDHIDDFPFRDRELLTAIRQDRDEITKHLKALIGR
jgi:hypothetical protein